MKRFVRFSLALLAFFVVLFPFSVIFTPPDPFTQLIALAIGGVVALPITVVFVRRSSSLERLYGYVLAIYVLVFVVGIVFFGVVYLLSAVGVGGSRSGLVWTIEQTIYFLFVYALAFELVYRGGYGRLKARLA